MKKSLLLNSIFCFLLLAGSCHNRKINAETKPVIADSALAVDTTKTKMQTGVSGTAGEGDGVNKDSTKTTTTNTAIIQGTQSQVDSIKKAKAKPKNP
jgi:hypothetical protein